jgi:hypothetical protein
MAIILLLGVTVFGYIMGNFTDIIGQMSEINTSFNDDENLTKFFSTLKKFNHNKDIKLEFAEEIEDFFQFKWKFDRNQAIIEDQDRKMLAELPDFVQVKIYTSYLFKKFLIQHR